MDRRYVAADGATIEDGKRMFNYYDCEWVIIDFAYSGADPTDYLHETWDGWFRTKLEDGSRGPVLNGERLAGAKPAWMV